MKTVFVNGTFDVLHPGHIALLESARLLGDRLLVAIDSDRRVSEKKGENRPFFNSVDRKKMLESLRCVDKVVGVFDSDEELESLVKFYKPDHMVVGEEYQGQTVIGSQFSGPVRFFRRLDEYSTTRILQNLSDR